MKKLLFAALLLCSWTATAQVQPKYFGYYANNGAVSENADHTNITHIGVWTSDRVQALNSLLAELQQARAHGVKAMLAVAPFLFKQGAGGACPYQLESSASIHWNTLVTTLVDGGYIVPGNSAASTVVAFYPVDEPEKCGLSDASGLAHPALANALSTIRADYRTRDIPVAVIASENYGSALQGLRLFDWTGLDCYGCGSVPPWQDLSQTAKNTAYLDAARSFWAKINVSQQKHILVPQAATGGMMTDYGYAHNPTIMYQAFLGDPKMAMLLPFLWKHTNTTGVSGNASLKADYNTIGHMIRNDAEFMRQSVPAYMDPGATQAVSVTLRNTGTTTWAVGGTYRLKAVGASWGIGSVVLAQAVPSGSEATFNFNVVAPAQAGTYGFRWQMERTGVVLFGQPTANVQVTVGDGDEPPPSGGECNPVTHICTEVP
ncbi:NBR1-Ig-like domain-containing protein [Agrilutibacter niabensis]|nr:NBR1-Ig-like domain-containing protein [Lysobacter niabensis]